MAHVTSTGNGDGHSMQETARQLGDGLKGLRNDVSELASVVGGELKARVSDAAEVSRDQAHRALEATRAQVRQHPAATIGIAAGAGFVIGLLLASRR